MLLVIYITKSKVSRGQCSALCLLLQTCFRNNFTTLPPRPLYVLC